IYAEEMVRERQALVDMVGIPLFHLGLRLTGRALARRADHLSRIDPAAWDQRSRHTASKLLAYLGRFTTKTSPQGVFCSTGLGERAEEVIRKVGDRVGRDVRPFYTQLVERGVLIGEVEIPWSERRPLRALAARCAGASWARELVDIERTVDSLAIMPFQEVER